VIPGQTVWASAGAGPDFVIGATPFVAQRASLAVVGLGERERLIDGDPLPLEMQGVSFSIRRLAKLAVNPYFPLRFHFIQSIQTSVSTLLCRCLAPAMPSAPRSAVSPTAEDVRDPRVRILSAAGQEFAEHGYDTATVRDICRAAGVNVAAVNYYFGDKRRLYIESVKHAHEERLRQVPQPEWSPGTPATEKLHDFIDNMLERMLGEGQPPWQVRLMMREVLHPTEACRELVEDYIRPHFALLVSILDELAAGKLSQAELRRLGMSVVGQCFVYRAAGDVVAMLVPRDEIDSLHAPKPLADHITQSTLAALGVAPPLTTVSSFHSVKDVLA
jgi:AcrR family transcriptional regulator